MRKLWVSLCAATALMLTGSAVRADNIPWGYSASDTTIYNSPVQTSSIAFTGASSVATGNSGIIIYNVTTSSGAELSSPDSFSNVPFNLSVTLTDINATSSASLTAIKSGAVNFAGLFNATQVSKASMLPGNNSWTTPVVGDVVLGSDDTGWRKYEVTIASFTPPGQPGGAPGSILAVVNITPSDGPGGSGNPPPDAPEPTSLLLAGLALPALLLARRRRNKVAQA